MKENIEICPSVEDAIKGCGVDTLEGRIGPLLKGEECSAHYILMPPGLYCGEHSHDSESIIYTASGSWVLANRGRRTLMREGSLFRFARGEPTGYEVPFDEPALILIFKGAGMPRKDEFLSYLEELAHRLEAAREDGEAFRLEDLPPEHPARVFARQLEEQKR
ncbi:MAG: cupin domain-containing protein [Actinobacteria bacterium]|nr:cupin domain-containing protein [Actinomycetota bacterium]